MSKVEKEKILKIGWIFDIIIPITIGFASAIVNHGMAQYLGYLLALYGLICLGIKQSKSWRKW